MIKKYVLIIFVFLLMINIAHHILNSIYQPFTGFIDVAMHGVLFLSGLFYILSLTYLVLRLSDRYKRQKISFVVPTILILVLIAEAIYTYNFGHTDNIEKMSSNGGYYMLYPIYFGGFLQGVLTAVVAKATIQNRKLLFFFFFAAQLWIAIPLVCDSLLFTEGSRRGTGILFTWTIISDLIWGYLISLIVLFKLLPVWTLCFCIFWVLPFAIQFFKSKDIDCNLASRFNWSNIALASSILFLYIQMSGWLEFIAD